jgi:hypothetical protein
VKRQERRGEMGYNDHAFRVFLTFHRLKFINNIHINSGRNNETTYFRYHFVLKKKH